MATTWYHNPIEERLEPKALERLQRQKLAALLRVVVGHNPFYTRKLEHIDFDPANDPLENLPFTTRKELEADHAANPPYSSNLTYPLERYCRYHQTSGSGGRPLRWLDTAHSWDWFRKLWATIYTGAGIRAHGRHRMLFPFSFGPFVGFWGAFEGATSMGNLAIPAGGLTTSARLKMMVDNRADVVCCTPTYALHMAEVAQKEEIDLPASGVRWLVVAGEPGGSIPEVRGRIEALWGARVIDHTGMTEMGAVSFECAERPGQGVHIIETEFIPEVIDPATGQAVPDGEPGELVLTNLGRWGSPLIRYRTNDQVRMRREKCACGRWFARLEGGILGRIDDMFTVRGNNVFPSGLEAVIRRFPEVAEFRVKVYDGGGLTDVRIEVEPAAGSAATNGAAKQLADRVAHAIHDSLFFSAKVSVVPAGTLPRFELKARRFERIVGE